MKRNGKRGFTIVELVVVIAVVAILAAVLIPTFASVIKKANVNNDVVLVKELNDGLRIEEVGGKKNNTMTDALNVAKDYGFEVEKLTPRSSGEILWDSVNNRFALLDENGNAVYKDESKTLSSGADLWKIVADAEGVAANTEYSSYIKGNATIATLTVTNGVDVGENIVNELTYKNTTGTAKTVTIRTNSFDTTLTINDSSTQGKIYHYNNLGKLIITDCAMESYHEMGIVGYAELQNGHLVVEENASINLLFANSQDPANLKITNNGTITYAQASNDDVKQSNTISGVDFNRENAATVSDTDIQQAVQETHQSNCEHANIVVSKEAKDPTCTETGLTVEKSCADCHKVLIAQEVVPTIAHTLTHTAAKAATCTEDGNIEYWTCSVCGKLFADAGATQETTVNDVNIPATGNHTYVNHQCVCGTAEPGWEGFAGKVDANGRLKDGVFENNTDITSIIIPEGVTEIGNSAFKKCTNLTSVTISSTVERIGEQAFNGCTKLSSITIPSTVKIVSKNAFYECTKLNSLTILNGVQSIQDSAFGYCSNLQSVAIPSSVTYIGASAFSNCTSLTSVVIQSTATIQAGAFLNCTSLSTIELHSTKVNNALFTGCTSLSSVKFGAEVTSIKADAFSNTPIVTVEVDTQNTNYKHDDDKDCVLSYDGKTLVLGCVNTTIPSTVTTIETYSFHKRNITSITIPSSVTKIEQFAFYESSLTSATFEGITNNARWSLSPYYGKSSVGYTDLSNKSQIASFLKANYAACTWMRSTQ